MGFSESELVGREWVSLNSMCNKSFSSTFEMIESRLIGLYEETSVGCFPGFSIMITLPCLNSVGQYSSLSIALYSYNNNNVY